MHKLNEQSISLPRRVLITRPAEKAAQLAAFLRSHQLHCMTFPLVSSELLLATNVQMTLDNADIIIAISENAVTNAQQQLSQWPEHASYFAVGNATRLQFAHLGISAASPEIATSEGLLALVDFAEVQGKNVVILRGEGGREYLAQQLVSRGASVRYLEVYRRRLLPFDSEDCLLRWQREKINTIVVTSGEILQHLYDNIGENRLSWLQNISLIVPSKRIALIARELGAINVKVSDGADNQAILTILLTE